MKLYNIVFSIEPPMYKNCVWAKPIEGGFTLYLLENGTWKPLKLVDDNGTSTLADDVKQDLVGTNADDWSDGDHTLNGLKTYVDSQIAALD